MQSETASGSTNKHQAIRGLLMTPDQGERKCGQGSQPPGKTVTAGGKLTRVGVNQLLAESESTFNRR